MKAIFSLMMLCISFSTTGQQHSISINYIPSFSYFGKQSQNFKHPYFHSGKGEATFRQSVNILYRYQISPSISISGGIEYAQQGQNISFIADSVYPSNTRQELNIELNYIRIPFTIGWSFFREENAHFNIYSGISLGLAIHINDNYQRIIPGIGILPPPYARYKKIDWAIPVGIKYQRQITARIFAHIGCEYLIGVTNAFSENTFDQYGVLKEFAHSRQSRLGLNVGIGMHLGK